VQPRRRAAVVAFWHQEWHGVRFWKGSRHSDASTAFDALV
jgi:hypothetical protein